MKWFLIILTAVPFFFCTATADNTIVHITLVDGSELKGKSVDSKIKLSTQYKTHEISPAWIKLLRFNQDYSKCLLQFANGDEMSGKLELNEFKLKTLFGDVKIPLKTIKHLHFMDERASMLGLKFYLGFNNKTIIENSRHSHRITVTETSLKHNEKGGGTAFFNGKSEINAGAVNLELQDEMAIALWLKPDKIPSRTASQYANILTRSQHFYLTLQRSGYIYTRLYGTAPSDSLHTAKAIKADVWTHIALSYKSNYLTFYINGIAEEKQRLKGIIRLPKDDDLFIGRYMPSKKRPTYVNAYTGEMDDIMIFNRALTAEEIKTLASDKEIPAN